MEENESDFLMLNERVNSAPFKLSGTNKWITPIDEMKKILEIKSA
jgi:hypothetical protein